jgi:hypothetical protein
MVVMNNNIDVKNAFKAAIITYVYLLIALILSIIMVFLASVFLYPLNLFTPGDIIVSAAIMTIYYIIDFSLLYLKKLNVTLIFILAIIISSKYIYKFLAKREIPLPSNIQKSISEYILFQKGFTEFLPISKQLKN